MTIAHDAYIALLAELTTRKNEKEIWWEDEYGKITVELLDAEKETYVIRSYYDNGNLRRKFNCLNGQQHGPYKCYYPDGGLLFEHNYLNGKLHGLCRVYHYNGKLAYKENYLNGNLV